jgi:hypothetical protein
MQWIQVVKDHAWVVVFQYHGKSIHEAKIRREVRQNVYGQVRGAFLLEMRIARRGAGVTVIDCGLALVFNGVGEAGVASS